MAKLRRSPHDKPDFPDEIRQPTCYEPRDPVRPWLAAPAYEDDLDDIELARDIASRGPIAFPSLGSIAPREEAPRITRLKHQPPDAEVLHRPVRNWPRVTLADLHRRKEQLHANRTAPAPLELHHARMRYVVHFANAHEAQIELLGDPGVLVGVFPIEGTERPLRLVAEVPTLIPTPVLLQIQANHSHNFVRVPYHEYLTELKGR